MQCFTFLSLSLGRSSVSGPLRKRALPNETSLCYASENFVGQLSSTEFWHLINLNWGSVRCSLGVIVWVFIVCSSSPLSEQTYIEEAACT